MKIGDEVILSTYLQERFPEDKYKSNRVYTIISMVPCVAGCCEDHIQYKLNHFTSNYSFCSKFLTKLRED